MAFFKSVLTSANLCNPLCRYFQMLQLLGLTFFFCAMLQIQNLEYYKSEHYSQGQVRSFRRHHA